MTVADTPAVEEVHARAWQAGVRSTSQIVAFGPALGSLRRFKTPHTSPTPSTGIPICPARSVNA